MFAQATAAGPVAAYGLGQADTAGAIAPAGTSPAYAGVVRLPGGDFWTSAELGLLIGLALVVYIDGRVLPRRR